MTAPFNWRDLIAVHPAADLFPMMPNSEIDELARDIEANSLQSPLSIWRSLPGATWQLIDGRNRVAAMARLADGDELIRGVIGLANQHEAHVDPWAFVISANIRRRHLSSDQKRELIASVLRSDPSRSDRSVAAITRSSPSTVGSVRNGLEVGVQIGHQAQRIGRDGVAQPAHKPAHRQPPDAVVQNTVPRHYVDEPQSVIGQFRVAPSMAAKSASSVVGAFMSANRSSATASAPTPTPSDFEVRASKFMGAIAGGYFTALRSGTLPQRCRLAARFIDEIDVAVEDLERFVNSPDDGAAQ